MAIGKNSPEIIKFMALFQKLRNLIDDEPGGLEELAVNDPELRQLCDDLDLAATLLWAGKQRRRSQFAAPVNPKFVSAWRDYEERYELMVFGAKLSGDHEWLGFGPAAVTLDAEQHRAIDVLWDRADSNALAKSSAVEAAFDYAKAEASNIVEFYSEEDVQQIEEGLAAWAQLKHETGLDLQGVFRRRELIPFVLVPRHVAQKHGSAEPLSLYTHLRQAHDAFVFGTHFAAVALMRSILETVLKLHYQARGDDLNELIKNCGSLPRGASKGALHRLRQLANEVLHVDKETARLPKDLEKELLSLFKVLRTLIEGAPTPPSR